MNDLRAGDVAQFGKTTCGTAHEDFQPTVQCLQIKPVTGATNRFRAVLSDGRHFIQGMLATQLNPMVNSGQIKNNSVIQVKKFLTNKIQDRTVVILMDFALVRHETVRLGQPVDIEKSGLLNDGNNNNNNPAAAPAQPLYNATNNAAPSAAAAAGKKGSPNPYQAPASRISPGAPIVRSNDATNTPYTSIAALNMYHNKWTIRARVTSKSDIRTWSNAKGDGSLFSIELLDQSMDIRATFFKEAVDKFYNMLQEGKVYTFSGGRLKVANAQWNTCKSSFEATFDQNSEIHLCNDSEGNDIQAQHYDFVKINDIESVEAGKMVDICCIVQSVGDVANITSKKSGQELTKCDLMLVDDSATQISLTLWGAKAQDAATTYANTPVVAFKRAKVSDYGGRSLSLAGSAQLQPAVPEAQALQQWWQTSGASGASIKSLSTSGGGGGRMDPFDQRKDIAAIKSDHLGLGGDKPDWLTFKATISFIKKDKEGGAWYPACANAGEPCKNRFKVSKTPDNQWYCDKCSNNYPNCVRRFIFSGVVEDGTSSTWVSFFNEQAETLLGTTADELHRTSFGDGEEAQDQDAYDSIFHKANHTEWILKCKVKNEEVNEESRVKTSVYAMQPVNYVQESRDMLRALESM